MGFPGRRGRTSRQPPRGASKRRLLRAALVIGSGLLALSSAVARAERTQEGNVIVALNAGITPRKLPRNRRAPVTVHLGGRVLTADHSALPRVNWIRLELAWRGTLDTRGLPVCPRERLVFADTHQALERCRAARVGAGHLYAQIFLPNQSPYGTPARLEAFNGRAKDGGPVVLVHAYSPEPPVSFVIPFRVRHQPGTFRTVLVTVLRRSVGPWPHVADFAISVSRRFMYRGRRHSYLSASCPIPDNFTAGFLSLARATYALSDGRQVTAEAVRSCRAGTPR
jgi:hypothetical protein